MKKKNSLLMGNEFIVLFIKMGTERKYQLFCEYWNSKSKSKYNFQGHLKSKKHEMNVDSNTDFLCTVCNYATYDKSHCNQHLKLRVDCFQILPERGTRDLGYITGRQIAIKLKEIVVNRLQGIWRHLVVLIVYDSSHGKVREGNVVAWVGFVTFFL